MFPPVTDLIKQIFFIRRQRLHETRIGDSTMHIGLTVVFGRNDEAWKGRIADIGALRNGKTFY
jgi:hypothetical protein